MLNPYGRKPSISSSSSAPKIYRCAGKYSLGQVQSQSPYSSWGSSSTSPIISETDLLKYEDLNMDLKEINILFKNLNKKKTQKNSNITKLSRKKTNTQSNRIAKENQFKEEETKFAKNIKKILSEKIRDKALQRLDRLINNPKEERLNKVACTLSALLEVLKSCGASSGHTSYDDLIEKYKAKIAATHPSGSDDALGFLNAILEKKDISLKDFIAKQSTHNKKLGEVLKTTIKELPLCPP